MVLVKQQQGMTLATTLVFLVLMTIVAVSATKISILDILVAGNEQQQMLLHQQSENDLKTIVNVSNLYKAVGPDGFQGNIADNNKKFKLDDSTNYVTKIITDLSRSYTCERNGRAMSMGRDAPQCSLYNFEVKSNSQGSGAHTKLHGGAGKMAPNLNANML